jgi:DUF917 family protein
MGTEAVVLGPADVPALTAGAGLFAAGAPILPIGQATLTRHTPVPLTVPPGDALVIAITTLGPWPAWPDDAAWRAAVRVAGQQARRRIEAVAPLGARDMLAAVHAAAVLGLPCVDTTAAGRGADRLDLTPLALDGVAADPVLASRDGLEVVAVRRAGAAAAHRIAATVADDMGGAVVAAYPADAEHYAAAGGAVSRCLLAGHALLRGEPPVPPLFTGTVADIAGAGRGTATITCGDRLLRLDYDGTYLVATEDGVVRAATPDLLCVLAADRGTPVAADRLTVGERVHVLVVPAAPRWLLRDGLTAAGPRRFGYDVNHVRTTDTTWPTHGVALEIGS